MLEQTHPGNVVLRGVACDAGRRRASLVPHRAAQGDENIGAMAIARHRRSRASRRPSRTRPRGVAPRRAPRSRRSRAGRRGRRRGQGGAVRAGARRRACWWSDGDDDTGDALAYESKRRPCGRPDGRRRGEPLRMYLLEYLGARFHLERVATRAKGVLDGALTPRGGVDARTQISSASRTRGQAGRPAA